MNYISSDTTVIFLPGNHTAGANKSIVIANVSNIILKGNGSAIQCTESVAVGFVFIRITNLSVSNLHFYHCGAVPEEVHQDTFDISHFTSVYGIKDSPCLCIIQVSHVHISGVYIYNSTGSGLFGLNVMGNFIISQSSFIKNNRNCVIQFINTAFVTSILQNVAVSIHHSKFIFGKIKQTPERKRRRIAIADSGLSIIIHQISYNISISINNATARANSHGSILFEVYRCNRAYVAIYLNAVICSHTQLKCLYLNINTFSETHVIMNISQSYFGQNIEAITLLLMGQGSFSKIPTGVITLENTTFYNNSEALSISGMHTVLNNVNFTQNFGVPIEIVHCTVIIKGNSTFIENRGNNAGVITIKRSYVEFQGNTTFLRNRGEKAGAIYNDAAQLYFKDSVQFVENVGYNGGAVAFYEAPSLNIELNRAYNSLNIHQNAKVIFTKNHARHYGGAIYIDKTENYMYLREQFPYTKELICFYKPIFTNYTLISTGLMVFTNNTSDVAGSAIYGGWFQLCSIQEYHLLDNFLNEIFQIKAQDSDLSPVSSEPYRVCMCYSSKPACWTTVHTVIAYPGETFRISAVAVGQMNGTVPSTVDAHFHQANSANPPNINTIQRVQKTEKNCSFLSYTVKSSNVVEDLILTVDRTFKLNVALPVYALRWFKDNMVIHIKLKPCPMGFFLKTSVCICHPHLQALAITCERNTGRILREAQLWINATFNNEVLTGFLVHHSCPLDYCKHYSLNLSLENPDEQCAFHRSGVLCGACQQNFSHVLGSSNCKQCTNYWLVLFIPIIALAGIILVAFLMLLNLTVSVGTINGLIFYANIVRLNQAVFFPSNTNNTFLGWFVAWVNLDFGIEACFYNAMDAYAKTWLQFVFPIYIWLIAALIIVSSHYSVMAAKISGRNSVQVLATLFLLSYTKLLRLTVTIFSSTTLEHTAGSNKRVWLFDGNVDYLRGKHIPLFMAALLVLLVLSLPYTTLLLFIQCLQLKTKYRVLFWIGKFKPLFDAYTGLYKDKHRYWTGLLLLVRAVLLLAFTVNIFGDPATNLLAIIIAVSCLLFYLAILERIYKNRYLNILECSFLLNIIILSTATLYTRPNFEKQATLTKASVGIVFATFCAILLYHTQAVVRIKCFHNRSHLSEWLTVQVQNLKAKAKKHRHDGVQQSNTACATPVASRQQVPITFIELREPLLAD